MKAIKFSAVQALETWKQDTYKTQPKSDVAKSGVFPLLSFNVLPEIVSLMTVRARQLPSRRSLVCQSSVSSSVEYLCSSMDGMILDAILLIHHTEPCHTNQGFACSSIDTAPDDGRREGEFSAED